MIRIFKKILIAIDWSEASARAVRVGYSMAASMGAEVLLVHVVNHPPAGDGVISDSRAKLLARLRRRGRLLLRKMRGIPGGSIPVDGALREGIPAEEILAAATDWGAQLIVLGAQGQSRLGDLLLGSTADAVARRARCPVVTVGEKSETTAARCLRAEGRRSGCESLGSRRLKQENSVTGDGVAGS